jgi:hypothetical protein
MTSADPTRFLESAAKAACEAGAALHNPTSDNLDLALRTLQPLREPLLSLQGIMAEASPGRKPMLLAQLTMLEAEMRRLSAALEVPETFLMAWRAARTRGYDANGAPVSVERGRQISYAG